MAAASGSAGTVKTGSGPTVVAEVTGWTLNKKVPTHDYASNSSGGFKNTTSGPKKATGTVKGMFDMAAASALVEGASLILKLYLDATHFYNIPIAVISDVSVGEVDINDGGYIPFSANWESSGTYSEPTLP